ncbi:MAG: hypothetical protein WAV11_00195 [Minisyncoccia bacterium]
MKRDRATGVIRIIKVPIGEAPLKIRQAWKGLLLPCCHYLGFPDSGGERGVLSKKKASVNRYGFSVPQKQALQILGQEKPKAAKWWKEHDFPMAGQYFCFAENEAEIVSGVVPQQLIEVTDEMRGNPYR